MVKVEKANCLRSDWSPVLQNLQQQVRRINGGHVPSGWLDCSRKYLFCYEVVTAVPRRCTL